MTILGCKPMTEVQRSGYSGTPLVKKLGIKTGVTLAVLNPPDHYWELLEELPDALVIDSLPPYDFVHFFTTDRAALENLKERS